MDYGSVEFIRIEGNVDVFNIGEAVHNVQGVRLRINDHVLSIAANMRHVDVSTADLMQKFADLLTEVGV